MVVDQLPHEASSDRFWSFLNTDWEVMS